MGKFKVGQWVRALVDWDSAKIGGVYKVTNGPSEEVWIEVPGSCDHLMFDYEVEPWTPRVGERVRFTQDNLDGGGQFGTTGDVVVVASNVQEVGMHGRYVRFTWPGHDWTPAAPLSCIEPVAAEVPSAKLQIEAGKFYKTRDGRKVGPMEQSWGAWRDADRRITSQSWFTDGTFIQGHVSQLDLISEWVEPASNDNAPVGKQPAAKPPKFQVGDRVRCLKSCPGQFTEGKIYAVSRDYGGREYENVCIALDDSGSSKNGWHPKFFELVTGPLTPTPTAIVAVIENGQPKPAVRPHVHANPEAAKKEADRLANKFKGKQFGVYVLSSTSEQANPVYDHKWQRLAADGLKIDAIKELRGITGMGLKPAKDAVEYFLAAA